MEQLVAEWKQTVDPIHEEIQNAIEDARALFPDWQLGLWKNWNAPLQFENAAQFGTLEVELNQLAASAPKDSRMSVRDQAFRLPLLLTYPNRGSILFETSGAGSAPALAAINNIIFRLLSRSAASQTSGRSGAHASGNARAIAAGWRRISEGFERSARIATRGNCRGS